MSAYIKVPIVGLHDAITNALVGVLGGDGKEYLFPAVYGPANGYMDTSATAGSTANAGLRGKAAFAAGQFTCTVTNSGCKSTSLVLAVLQSNDTTLTQILRIQPNNGSFIVAGNAAATGTPSFGYHIFN